VPKHHAFKVIIRNGTGWRCGHLHVPATLFQKKGPAEPSELETV
jgi:hypothetical protein